MINARFVERTAQGKFAHFALTRDGLLELEKREGKKRSQVPALLGDKCSPAGAAHPHYLVANVDAVLRSFDLAIQNSGHAPHTAGLLGAGDSGFRRAMEDYLLHFQGPAPAAPEYMKVRTKNSYQDFSVTVVQTKTTEAHGSYAIEAASSPKAASFPVGALHLYEEDEHVE